MPAGFRPFAKRVNLILALDHAGRAGNGFFQTIFDQHPQVITCPWMHYVYSYIITLLGDDELLDRESVLDRWSSQQYFRMVCRELDDRSRALIVKMGGDADATLDRALAARCFSAIVSAQPKISRRDVVIATYYAYARGLGRDIEQIKYILVTDSISLRTETVKTGFSGRVVDLVVRDFPQARLVHLVRDPHAGFASTNHQFINEMGNMYGVQWGNVCSRFLRLARLEFDWDSVFVFGFWLMYFRRTFEAAMRKRAEYAGLFFQVRNEDLNLDFVPTMERVAQWLDIEMLQEWKKGEAFVPTMLGRQWRGTGAYNSRYSPEGRLKNDPESVAYRATGPNRHVTERWKSRLARREIVLIEKFLWPEFVQLDYSTRSPNEPSLWRWLAALAVPLRGEMPSLVWLQQGWREGWQVFRHRLVFCLTWPIFFVATRVAFFRVYRDTKIFRK